MCSNCDNWSLLKLLYLVLCRPTDMGIGMTNRMSSFAYIGVMIFKENVLSLNTGPVFVPRCNEVVEGGYWITLCPAVRPLAWNNFKSFGRILMISHRGMR